MSSQMWFGTEGRSRWIPTPASGAESTPQAYNSGGTLLNGGGYTAFSFGSHRLYSYSWSQASSRQAAQMMQSYKDGSYGRGLLYFVEPTIYDTNVLPKHWADPSMALNDEAPALVRSFDPQITSILTTDPIPNDLPTRSVRYNLSAASVLSGYPGPADSLFIPVPPGFALQIGAFYTATGAGGVFAGPVNAEGDASSPVRLTPTSNSESVIMKNTIAPGSLNGVRLWVGKSAAGSATVTISALIARLIPVARQGVIGAAQRGPWIGGQGHSGCRFDGPPTYVTYTGVNGGQVGYAASFREVGSWEYV